MALTTLDGLMVTAGTVDSTALGTNAVTTVKVTDSNITGAKLANSAVILTKMDSSVSGANKFSVAQTGHGFTTVSNAGNHIKIDGSGNYILSTGTTGNSESVSIIESVTNANNFIMVESGLITLSGLTLTPGVEYFQHGVTAGATTTTAPTATGTVKRSLYVAQSATTAIVRIATIGIINP